MKLLALILATCSVTLPLNGVSRPGHCRGDSALHSWVRLEIWFQPRASPWPPLDWRTWAPRYAPQFLIASRDSSPGSVVRVEVPLVGDGTLIPRVRGPGGLSCDGNYLPSNP